MNMRIALLGLALLLTPLATASSTRPALRLVTAAPLTVRGTHFVARERVVVKASVDGTVRKRVVRASTSGAFRASFNVELGDDRCTAARFVIAIGARGDRAALKLPKPLCPPS